MDGTLLDSYRQITPINVEAIKRAQENGINFIINTGREYPNARGLVETAGLKCDLICSNGACAFDKDGNLIKIPGYDGRLIPKVKKYYDWDAIGIEGAYVIKRNGIYYLFYSSWTRGYEIGYATARNIRGPWKKHEGNPIYGAMNKSTCHKNGFTWSGDANSPFNQVGHNEVFTGPDGRLWLSCHGITDDNPEQPALVIDPIDFDEEGNIRKKIPSYTLQTTSLDE